MNSFFWWPSIDFLVSVTALLFFSIVLILLFVLWRHANIRIVWRMCHTVTTVFSVALLFYLVDGLLGYPTREELPERFVIHGVVFQADTPDADLEDGYIVLMVRENVEDVWEMPRTHILPYSEELAELIRRAQKRAADGGHRFVEGTLLKDGRGEEFWDSERLYEFRPLVVMPGRKER